MKSPFEQTRAAIGDLGGSAVLTALDAAGRPLSLRCRPAESGDTFAIDRPDWFDVVDGRACLNAHSHDDQGWNLRGMLAKGTAMITADKINFRPTVFLWTTNGLAIGVLIKSLRTARNYLKRRGLARPITPWQELKAARAEVRRSDPSRS